MNQGWRTLVDVLRWQAEHIGDQVVFTFLSGPTEERITYAELDARARAVAVELQKHCVPGDRAMLVYPVGLRYIEAFFGCMYAGVIAVPAYPPHPNHASRGLSKFQGIVTDCQPSAILTTDRLQRMLSGVRDGTPALQVPWIPTSDSVEHAERWITPAIGGDDLAFLQYTSGSTADPKGVMVRHRNLLANLALIVRSRTHKPDELMVSWLPPYHDMGLIGSILLPVFGGGPAVLMPPASFLQRPLWWLETISRFRGTYGAAPDFAYDLCVRAVEHGLPENLDLSCWTTFLDGAEPVRASTIAAFHRAFGPAGVPANGITPSYGLAEATLMVTTSDPKLGSVHLDVDPRELAAKRALRVGEGEGKRLVSSGRRNEFWDLRIVDPETRRVVADGQVGEIWLRGPCVTAGYWRKPELTRETFEARLARDVQTAQDVQNAQLPDVQSDMDARFLRTGDMGFMNAGDLYVTGRLKEMICVRGRNLYPHDIELALEPLAAHNPALRGACAAVGVEIDGREEIVIFHEIERRAGPRRKVRTSASNGSAVTDERRQLRDRRARRSEPQRFAGRSGRAEDELAIAIATAAAQHIEARVAAVVLLAPTTLPRTSSGKARRIACRNSFTCDFSDGTLSVLHVWRPEAFARSATAASATATTRNASERASSHVGAVPASSQLDGLDPLLEQERCKRTYRELVEWLTTCFASKLGVPVDAVDPLRPFIEFGLDSALAVEIAGHLSEFAEQELSATLFWDCPNIDALAAVLACDRSAEADAVIAHAPAAVSDEAFAIVGMACKLPGADDVEAFWQLLREGKSGVSEGAAQRFRELGGEGELSVPAHGGFVSGIERFDAGFFAISAREAIEMDPQQRMLLEVGFHALEDVGVAPSRWAGSRTGVFVGISSSDYGMIAARSGRAADVHSGTGNAHSIAANRFSYAFDLRGPSLAVDTACSSSLLAVHLGCESLRRGESDAVVVAGVNAILSSLVTAAFDKAHMIALDGRCKTFAADADGYVRGEGCAAFVLKRLSDAVRDGDRIRAVIRGSAVNQDGRSNGLTAPNGGAQRAVVRAALVNARLQREDIDYIEAHGTGTELGDPIEAAALGAVLASPTRAQPWLLGAVKANIGHLEAAAGVAGLAKLVLCLEREAIPGQIHLGELNPKIDLTLMGAQIPRENMVWPRGARARRAGVSSFGFGGTNVHVIVEEAPRSEPPAVTVSVPVTAPVLLSLSARSETSLQALGASMRAHLQALDEREFPQACAAASATRAEFPYRLSVLARSQREAIAALDAHAAGKPDANLRSGLARKAGRVAFLFTGQGAQYPGMARELYETEPAFRDALDRCAAHLHGVLPLIELLIDPSVDPQRLSDTRVTQPLLFSFQYALAALWRTWGIEPDAVLGHSLGEYAAVCVAGAISLEQALELVVTRAQLMASVAQGSMAVVLASEAQVSEALAAAGSGRVSIAAYNGPLNHVLSGPAQDVDAVVERLTSVGVGARRLDVSHAFHSSMMDPMLAPFEAALAGVQFGASRAQIVSNVSGTWLDAAQLSARYFCDHTRQPVQFAAGVGCLLDSGVRHLIEIGPHAVLTNLIKRIGVAQVECVPSLKQGVPARETLLSALAALHVAGHAPLWSAVHAGLPPAAAGLPAYPFDRQRHWAAVEPAASATSAAVSVDPGVLHPLLDRVVEHSSTESTFEKDFTAADLVIAQHVVESIAILPGVAYVEAMLAAARWHLRRPVLRVDNVVIVAPLALDAEGHARMIVVARCEADTPEQLQLTVSSRRRDGSLIEHASCECLALTPDVIATVDIAALQQQPADRLEAELMYDAFRRVGIHYGEFFRSIRWVARRERETLAVLQLSPAAAATSGYLLHPALLDAALQSFAALISDTQDVTQLYVPLTIGAVELRAALGTRVYVHARRTDAGTSANLPELVRGSLSIVDERGQVLASVEEFSLKRVRLERTIADMIRTQTEGPNAGSSLSLLRQELGQEQARLRALYAIESYAGVGAVVDALCTRYVIDALTHLGCAPERGATLDPAQLAATFGISPTHQKLLDRMLQMLEQDGACTREPSGSYIWNEDDTRERPPSIDQLLESSPACSGELTLLRRCGENLGPVLRGGVTPLELLFPDGSLRLTEALYQESPFARYYNGILQTALRRIAASAGDRPLRVLEIGAGTGGTTSYVLPVLAGADVQYVFSDVSRLFLALAEKKFRGYSALEYALLDVEKTPLEQGFEPAGFDLIIAANVLHATLDIGQTLAHVRWLLRPQGTLLLLEGTGRQRATDLIFGLTDGWWRFQDERVAAGYPLLACERWLGLLREQGFADAVSLSRPDAATTWCEQLVIAASADTRVRALPQPVIAQVAQVPTPQVPTPQVPTRTVTAPAPLAAAATQPSNGHNEHASKQPPAADLVTHTRNLIVTELAAALRTSPEAIDIEQNFLDMGLDSLMAMEILGKLKARWSINIPPTVLFEHTNTLALAEYLARRHGDRLAAELERGAAASPAPTQSPAATPKPATSSGTGSAPSAMKAYQYQAPAISPRPLANGVAKSGPAREPADDAAIAVIGMACRFPGANNVDAFWQALVEGRDQIREIPIERWDTRQSGGCKYAGVLEHIEQFDPQFFEISPREARLIDPQQRLFLEVAWEAVEHAGAVITGTNTGVFVGCTNSDYFDRIKPHLTLDDYAAGLGNKNCIIPNRVSYVMNLRGPSVLVDTACSSSLVAMHMAMQSLRRGDCDQALVGGVNVLLSPLYYLALNRMGVQARDGRCKAFDHRADGFASGEGAGAVLLKPLARAIADGDRVYAVIRGSAVNHDGRSAGLAAPNPAAHAELIADAYRDAEISPDTVSYIEAHGTGTVLGDPIEIDGLTRAFRQWTERKAYCAIGSVKTNIGHLEPAAGIAGVIKTVLCLSHRYLPSSLHYERPNPHIALDETPFVVNAVGRAWDHAGPLRAGVSSFGMGGTNAHVVLEQAPPTAARPAPRAGLWLLALSARTLPALRALTARYAEALSARPELLPDELCFTAASGRVAMKHRLGIVGADCAELMRALKRLQDDAAWTNLDPRMAARGAGRAPAELGSVGILHGTRAQAEQAAALYAQGARLQVDPALAARKTALPTYPFEHMRCWVDEPAPLPVEDTSTRQPERRPHPFLRRSTRVGAAGEPTTDERAEPVDSA